MVARQKFVRFVMEMNITFVGEVEKHEVLYNYKLPGYSRKDITEKAWQEVAAKVNMSRM